MSVYLGVNTSRLLKTHFSHAGSNSVRNHSIATSISGVNLHIVNFSIPLHKPETHLSMHLTFSSHSKPETTVVFHLLNSLGNNSSLRLGESSIKSVRNDSICPVVPEDNILKNFNRLNFSYSRAAMPFFVALRTSERAGAGLLTLPFSSPSSTI